MNADLKWWSRAGGTLLLALAAPRVFSLAPPPAGDSGLDTAVVTDTAVDTAASNDTAALPAGDSAGVEAEAVDTSAAGLDTAVTDSADPTVVSAFALAGEPGGFGCSALPSAWAGMGGAWLLALTFVARRRPSESTSE